MTYALAIFDFDGTLADSFPFFLQAQHQLADKHGFARVLPHEVEALRRSSVSDLIKHSGLPAWKLPRIAHDFRAMMRDHTAPIPLFAGVDEMLGRLADAGVVLGLITSNAQDNAERILGAANFQRFTYVDCGMSLFGKPPRIRAMLRKAGLKPDRAIYIGDQDSDGEAARAEGVAFGAVGWGYGAPEILRAAGARHEFARIEDIAGLLAPS
jgi:phosphoglycolate phosphatase